MPVQVIISIVNFMTGNIKGTNKKVHSMQMAMHTPDNAVYGCSQ